MSESIQATPDMAVYCFDILHAHANKQKEPSMPASIPRHIKWFRNIPINFPLQRQFSPLFVTWKKGTHHHLRGCIGTFSNLSLPQGLREYAVTSAFHDSRFEPISKEEILHLHCGVGIRCLHTDSCAAGLSAGGLRTGQGLPRLGRGRSRNTHQLLGWSCQQKCCLFA